MRLQLLSVFCNAIYGATCEVDHVKEPVLRLFVLTDWVTQIYKQNTACMCFVLLIKWGDEDKDCECKEKGSCLKLCKYVNIRSRKELNVPVMLIINCTASLCRKRGKVYRIYNAWSPFLSFKMLKSKIDVDISRISGIFLKCCGTKRTSMNNIRNSKATRRRFPNTGFS